MSVRDSQDGQEPAAPSLDDMSQVLMSFSEEMDRQAKPRFDEMLQRIARQILEDEQAVQTALETGGFLLGEVTVVVRFNEENHQIELFGDIGLPALHVQDQMHRLALEHNLCRSYPGVMLGLHPESGRLVATSSLHLLLVTEDDMCLHAMQILATIASEARKAFELVRES